MTQTLTLKFKVRSKRMKLEVEKKLRQFYHALMVEITRREKVKGKEGGV